MNLSQCFARPRVVTIAGTPYLASPLRFIDMAAMEGFAADALPWPLDGLDETAPDYGDRLKALRRQEWPPSLGSQDVNRIVFGTLGGRIMFAMLVLRSHPGINTEACEAIVANATEDEWSRLESVAFEDETDIGTIVLKLIDKFIGVEPFEASRPQTRKIASWSEIIATACAAFSFTPAQLGEMTPGQLGMMNSGGKTSRQDDPLPADPEAIKQVNAKRWAFWHGKREA